MMWSERKYTMRLQEEEFDIQISCDRKRVYDALHEAIDNVLNIHYAPPTIECEPEDTELATKLKEAFEKRDKK